MDFLLNMRCDANGRIGLTESFVSRFSSSSSSSTSDVSSPTYPDALTASSDRIEWSAFVATSRGGVVGGGGGGIGSNGVDGDSPSIPRAVSRDSSPSLSPAATPGTPTTGSAASTPSVGKGLNLANAFQAIITVLDHVSAFLR